MCLDLDGDDTLHDKLSISEFPLKLERMEACRELCDDYATGYDGDFCCSFFEREEEGYPDPSDPWDSCWFVEGGEQIGAGMGH